MRLADSLGPVIPPPRRFLCDSIKGQDRHPLHLYDLPLYYDIAADWDISAETAVLKTILDAHLAASAHHLLEPACGSGRYLEALTSAGFHVTGYDRSLAMISFARKRLQTGQLSALAQVAVGDLKAMAFARHFDAALTLAGSLGYLLDRDALTAHLRHTAAALRPGGLYIIQLLCAWKGTRPIPAPWTHERQGVRVTTQWFIEREDSESERCLHRCRMQIMDHGHSHTLDELHTLRLWRYPELRTEIEAAANLRLLAIYNRAGNSIPLHAHISGEWGELFYVFRSTELPGRGAS